MNSAMRPLAAAQIRALLCTYSRSSLLYRIRISLSPQALEALGYFLAKASHQIEMLSLWSKLRNQIGPERPLGVCERCSKLDFLQNAPIDLGLVRDWSTTSCYICNWLFSRLSDEQARHAIILTPDSTFFDYPFPLLRSSNVTWWSNPSMPGFITQPYGAGPCRSLKPLAIDFDIIRHWLQLCKELHPNRCSAKGSPVPHLWFIDCESKIIVPATEDPYVTLSYVWGLEESPILHGNKLPARLPDTIVDALALTKALGYQYLWIDRYCINQQDAKHASAQMEQMDAIYSNSEVTIIALAGEDPAYGLPGVGRRSREPQFHKRIGSCVIMSSFEDSAVRLSHWNRRGWTYQEGLLSRRRLIFTDQQVIFECRGMCCHETLDLPYASMHTTQDERLDSKFHYSQSRVSAFPQGAGATPREIFERIEEYSRKDLSLQSDRLNAFLGILRDYYLQHGVRHLWGSPILHSPPANPRHMLPNSESGPQPENVDVSSQTEDAFVIGLCWEFIYEGPVRRTRVPSLPSWSWTGWSCGVIYYEMRRHEIAALDVTVRIEQEDRHLRDWSLFCADYASIGSSRTGRYIQFEAWTLPVSICIKNGVYCGRIRMHDGVTLSVSHLLLPLDVDIRSLKEFAGLLLCEQFAKASGDGRLVDRVFIMLVRAVNDDKDGLHMERVGSFWVGPDNYPHHAEIKTWKGSWHILQEGELRKRYGKHWWKAAGSVRKTHRLG